MEVERHEVWKQEEQELKHEAGTQRSREKRDEDELG
jgi:hypothetical protein